MKVLVTGGAGFIGSAVIRLAIGRGHSVVNVDAQRESHRSFKHLRWHLGSIPRIWTSPVFWRIMLGRLHLPAHSPTKQ